MKPIECIAPGCTQSSICRVMCWDHYLPWWEVERELMKENSYKAGRGITSTSISEELPRGKGMEGFTAKEKLPEKVIHQPPGSIEGFDDGCDIKLPPPFPKRINDYSMKLLKIKKLKWKETNHKVCIEASGHNCTYRFYKYPCRLSLITKRANVVIKSIFNAGDKEPIIFDNAKEAFAWCQEDFEVEVKNKYLE